MNRLEYIRKAQPECKLIEIWECEFDTAVKNDKDLSKFLNELNNREPLSPCNALYGGRNNVF